MAEDANGKINLPVVIPWLLTIIGVVIGAWQFILQQQQANRQPFLQKQLALCFEASETAARLASEVDPAEWEKDRQAFWRLYWGPLSIVEDPGVESAMVELGNKVPRAPEANPALPMESLGSPSYKLAHAFRDLILKSWNIDLPPLRDIRAQK